MTPFLKDSANLQKEADRLMGRDGSGPKSAKQQDEGERKGEEKEEKHGLSAKIKHAIHRPGLS